MCEQEREVRDPWRPHQDRSSPQASGVSHDAPRERFSPHAHWLAEPVVRSQQGANTAWLACPRRRVAWTFSGVNSTSGRTSRMVRFDIRIVSCAAARASLLHCQIIALHLDNGSGGPCARSPLRLTPNRPLPSPHPSHGGSHDTVRRCRRREADQNLMIQRHR